jgi:polyisoprenoid-binding protein YceI
MNKLTLSLGAVCFALLGTQALAADWNVDRANSQLNFMSIKKTSIAENHVFQSFSGSITDAGALQLTIDLSSVDTNIEIRNQRMRDYLFDVANFASAEFTAQVDMHAVETLSVGESQQMQVEGQLSLHGQTVPTTLDLMVSKLAANKLFVTTAKPIIVQADQFDLTKGIDKLMALAKLPSISHAVPVSFYLTLTAQ